jgi:hypothetical protein
MSGSREILISARFQMVGRRQNAVAREGLVQAFSNCSADFSAKPPVEWVRLIEVRFKIPYVRS